MSEPAGDLETLRPDDGDDDAIASAEPPQPTLLSMRARAGIFIGGLVFVVGALTQIFAITWLALLAFLFGGSAEVLVHTGGLESRTFAACSIAAAILDAVILLAVAMNSVSRSIRRRPPEEDRFVARHPFVAASLGLSLALAFVIACGWRPSPFFPYPLATIVVLASAYWFGLVVVLVFARIADLAWRVVKRWGVGSEWRAGFLTACLLVAGGLGVWLLTTRWYAAPLGEIEERLEIEPANRDIDVLASELDGLCLEAIQLEPELAQTSAAPACQMPVSTRPVDDCFTSLMKRAVPDARGKLRNRRLSSYDIDDAIMKAALSTCTREPLPTNLEAYFFTVARNGTWRMEQDAHRMVSCDQLAGLSAPECTLSDPREIRESKLQEILQGEICRLSEDIQQIFRRRLEQDESFREIGEHLGIAESEAKDRFHNAIKKLRRRIESCDVEVL